MLQFEEEFARLHQVIGDYLSESLSVMNDHLGPLPLQLSYYENLFGSWRLLFRAENRGKRHPSHEQPLDTAPPHDDWRIFPIRSGRKQYAAAISLPSYPEAILEMCFPLSGGDVAAVSGEEKIAEGLLQGYFPELSELFRHWKDDTRTSYPFYSFPQQIREVYTHLYPKNFPSLIILYAQHHEDVEVLYDSLRILNGLRFYWNIEDGSWNKLHELPGKQPVGTDLSSHTLELHRNLRTETAIFECSSKAAYDAILNQCQQLNHTSIILERPLSSFASIQDEVIRDTVGSLNEEQKQVLQDYSKTTDPTLRDLQSAAKEIKGSQNPRIVIDSRISSEVIFHEIADYAQKLVHERWGTSAQVWMGLPPDPPQRILQRCVVSQDCELCIHNGTQGGFDNDLLNLGEAVKKAVSSKQVSVVETHCLFGKYCLYIGSPEGVHFTAGEFHLKDKIKDPYEMLKIVPKVRQRQFLISHSNEEKKLTSAEVEDLKQILKDLTVCLGKAYWACTKIPRRSTTLAAAASSLFKGLIDDTVKPREKS